MLDRFIKVLELFSDDNPKIDKDTRLIELRRSPFDHRDFLTCVLILQAMSLVDIPEHLVLDENFTVEQFVGEVEKLPKVEDDIFVAKTMKIYVDLFGHRRSDEEAIN